MTGGWFAGCARATTALVVLSAPLLVLSACGSPKDEAAAQSRPVEIALVEAGLHANVGRLVGEVQAQKDIDVSFRVGGKVIDLPVNVGDRVKAGQLLARLDPVTAQNALRAAKAARDAARGELEHARADFERQEQLFQRGFTTRPRFEQALKAVEVGESRIDDAQSQVAQAQDHLGYTELRTDAEGVVVSRRIEVGEVVQAGQIVVRIARDDNRDAVFDVSARFLDLKPANGQFRVVLSSDPKISAMGRVREVATAADPASGTFRMRVGLESVPAAMHLGATVIGVLEKQSGFVVSVPAAALVARGREPAVWVVDPATNRVAMRRIEILQFDATRIIVTEGLEPGERVVTAGGQALHPGQLVQPMSVEKKRA